jgi:uncharacterized protein
MNGWKTLEGERIDNIHNEIRKEIELVDEAGGIVFAYIGCDGQNIGKKYTSFVQCVALHKFDDTGTGKGGRVYYIRHLEARYFNRNKRLLREAEIAINLASNLEPLFTEMDIPFEVHADVNSEPGKNNENKSNDVHDMIKGWITGMGFICKTKPQAFVSSIVCDRHTRSIKHKND